LGKREMGRQDKSLDSISDSPVRELFFWAQALVFALVLLVCVNAFFGRISGVKGDSMYSTLHNGDQVLVQLMGYHTPSRGDIVVVMTSYYPTDPLIKRVIGVGGDVINIDADGTVSVNGEKQYEPYIYETVHNLGNIQYPYTVPDDCIFVMGDNRNHSSDSRFSQIGPIPLDEVIGRAFFRIWPLTRVGNLS